MNKQDYVRSLKKIKLIIGNGFDCYCGLNTKYSDFFNSQKEKHHNIDEMDAVIYLNYRTLEQNNLSLPFMYVQQKYPTINFWDIYFYLVIQNSENKNWCDIEKEMFNFFNDISEVKISDIREIITMSGNFDEDDNDNIYYLARFLKSKYIQISSENFYDYIFKELTIFEKNFGQYINNEYESKKDHYIERANRIINAISQNVQSIVSKDTFNYTVVDDDFFKNFKHINGDYNEPIFGIDSTNISPTDERFRFTKISRRINLSMHSDQASLGFVNEDFENIVIFGHSLNEQDYNYFFPIFDYIKLSNPTEKSVIVFAYSIYDPSQKELIIKNLMSSVFNLIAAYDKYLTGREKESRLLDILSATGRIIMYEIE